MITLRHHLLTLVSVFLALAVGIVLGGGPLSDVGSKVASVQEGTSDAPVDPATAYDAAFLDSLGPSYVAGRLDERSVAVVTVPGADERLVTALTDQVAAAGGTVGARYALTEDMVDPGQKSLVDTLGSQLLTQQAEDAVPAEASTYDRMGQLLGLAVATRTVEGEDVTGKSRAVVDAMSGAGLLTAPEEVAQRSPLVLLVMGPDAGDEGSDAVLAGLAEGLGAQAAGVVVAGTAADGGSGQLGRLRADPAAASVATVDGIDTSAGRIATVLTLQKVLSAPGGAFGASGADGPLPLG